jgi:hypothetical protein
MPLTCGSFGAPGSRFQRQISPDRSSRSTVTLAAGFGGSRSTAKPDGFTKRPVGSLIAISEAMLAA